MDLLSTAIPIARGASGEVFEIFDDRLQRKVALKVLRHSDPDSVHRMMREARAQARIDHPNICRVHDVGERQGRPCITMQLVEGPPLDEAAADLALEARVELLATVAEAVQAAHAVGLIHRDLKPANILVEERHGALHPVVVDFGIAREVSSDGLTVTGALLGTPAYMSPEQVRGDVRAMDRRSDVFSLAVILYELIAGRHPFAAESTMETMVAITDRDPPPLRRWNPDVPADLDAVVARGLEKDLTRRYPSAAALASDLRLFLAGRPVTARRISRLETLERKARRNPVVTASLMLVAALTVAAAVIVVRTNLRADQQTRLAESFGRDVERAENVLRMAHLSPAHDLSPELQLVADRMAGIEATMETLGGPALGPGSYALGRGALALGDPSTARTRLEQALEAGFDGPQVQLALARAHLDLLDAALREADLLTEVEARREARRAAVARHGDAARGFVGAARRETRNAVPDGQQGTEEVLIRARVALAEERWDDARRLGLESAGSYSWWYDGLLVAAEADLRRAHRALEDGRGSARNLLQRSLPVLGEARERAPSDPATRLALCRAHRLEMDLDYATERAAEAFERALAACDGALALRPDFERALSLEALVAWRFGRWLLGRGRDPEPALRIADASARRLEQVAPELAEPLVHRANAELTRAEWAWDRGEVEAARDRVRVAIERFEGAAALQPTDPTLHENLSRAWRRLAEYDWSGGWEAAYAEASEVARRGLEVASGSLAGLHRAECEIQTNWAYQSRHLGRDPGDHARRAVDHCREAMALQPDNPSTRNSLALALWTEADVALARGEDAEASLSGAADAFASLLEATPEFFAADVNRGTILLTLAEQRLERGGAVDDLLAEVEAHAERIRDVYPVDHTYHRTRIELIRARVAVAAERSGEAAGHFDTARSLGQRLVREWPSPPTNIVLAAEVERRAAGWHLERGEGARAQATARSAVDLATQALEQGDDLAAAWIELALAADVLAATSTSEGAATDWRQRSRDAAERVVELALWVPPSIARLARSSGDEVLPTGTPSPVAVPAGDASPGPRSSSPPVAATPETPSP